MRHASDPTHKHHAECLAYRLLCAASQCHLAARTPGAADAARAAAADAAQLAAEHGLSPGPAQRHMGRVHASLGETDKALEEYKNAIQVCTYTGQYATYSVTTHPTPHDVCFYV